MSPRRFADAWTSLYVMAAAWAPVFWLGDSSRTHGSWERRELLGGLLTMHDLAQGVLVVHAWFIMIRFGLMVNNR
jgi:hypothetical protein